VAVLLTAFSETSVMNKIACKTFRAVWMSDCDAIVRAPLLIEKLKWIDKEEMKG